MPAHRAITAIAIAALCGAGAVAPRPAHAADDLQRRVADAREVYQELINTPDRNVPRQLREGCKCVAVLPHVVKGAIGFGARFGRGVICCRDAGGGWSPVAFVQLTGGSWGLQIGAESADVVLFFMTDRGVRSLLGSKFTLGAKAGVAAGPVGRTAEAATDVKLNAEIYSYARTKGLFAGVSLEGARIAVDDKGDERYYGAPVTAKQILFDRSVPKRPEGMDAFLDALR
ncbi:MAG: lipid-binding SYLF domain-containing protein [Candidatus Eisenbacteria bacterium]|nr:lipid-binding SYLF domain-containing protein [Candidatus Eisenbacteria bacterium]